MADAEPQPLTEAITIVTLPNGKQLRITVVVMPDLDTHSRADLLPDLAERDTHFPVRGILMANSEHTVKVKVEVELEQATVDAIPQKVIDVLTDRILRTLLDRQARGSNLGLRA